MTAAQKLNLISVEDYLAGELESQVKHEYPGGVVYAMAGARRRQRSVGGASGEYFVAEGDRGEVGCVA